MPTDRIAEALAEFATRTRRRADVVATQQDYAALKASHAELVKEIDIFIGDWNNGANESELEVSLKRVRTVLVSAAAVAQINIFSPQ